MKLKDSEKAYPLTKMCVRVFNRLGRLLLYSEAGEISHYELARDYTIALKGGGEVILDSGIVEAIVSHENEEK